MCRFSVTGKTKIHRSNWKHRVGKDKENLSENLRIESAVLTHGRAEARMEGLVVEIEVTTGLDHIAHDAAKS